MDWTKVRTKHYISNSLTETQCGRLVRFVCLVAHLEKMPSISDLQFTFKSKWFQIAANFPQIYGKTPEEIGQKVMEDVEKTKHSRKLHRDRQKTYIKKDTQVVCDRVEKSRVDKRYTSSDKKEDFIKKLKTLDAYKGLNIDRCLSQMDAWLMIHPGRQKNAKFIINWLNKELEKNPAISVPKAAPNNGKDKEQLEKWKKEAAPMPKECREQLTKFGIRSGV